MDTSQTWAAKGTRKTLRINRSAYCRLLQCNFHHEAYFDSFHSTQNCELSDEGPTKDDISISKSNIKVGLPYPVSSPTVTALTEKDVCMDLVDKKDKYLNTLAICKRKYKADRKLLTTRYLRNKKSIFLPKYFVDLTTGVIKDADPYFDSNYDYYYAGGTLSRVTMDGGDYLVHPTTNGKISFTATEVSPHRTNLQMEFNEHPVYNIRSYADDSSYISIRQKYELFLYKVKTKYDSTKLKRSLLWHTKSEQLPFIDCRRHDDEIAYADVTYDFVITDIESYLPKSSHKFPTCDDSKGALAQFEYIDKNTIFFMGSTKAHLCDKRTFSCKSFDYKVHNFNCDKLCALCVSKLDGNYVYTSSKHNTLVFDLRQMKVVRKWTHFLNWHPVINKSCSFQNSELLYISSFNEKVCLQVSKSENYIPFAIPGVEDTLLEHNLRKKLILRGDLNKRCNLSIAGLEPLNISNNDFALYTCNSIGDVFRNELSYEEPDREKALNEFTSWTNGLPPESKRMTVTSVKNMEHVKEKMTRPKTKNLKKYSKPNSALDTMLAELPRYDKYPFAAIWMDNMEIDDGQLGTVTPKNKVTEWLRSTAVEQVEEDVAYEGPL